MSVFSVFEQRGHISSTKTWRLRKRITELNKAIAGGKSHPNGMTRLTTEGCERELLKLRKEIARRSVSDTAMMEGK